MGIDTAGSRPQAIADVAAVIVLRGAGVAIFTATNIAVAASSTNVQGVIAVARHRTGIAGTGTCPGPVTLLDTRTEQAVFAAGRSGIIEAIALALIAEVALALRHTGVAVVCTAAGPIADFGPVTVGAVVSADRSRRIKTVTGRFVAGIALRAGAGTAAMGTGPARTGICAVAIDSVVAGQRVVFMDTGEIDTAVVGA